MYLRDRRVLGADARFLVCSLRGQPRHVIVVVIERPIDASSDVRAFTLEQHGRIVEALAAHDPALASAAPAIHVSESEEWLRKALRQRQEGTAPAELIDSAAAGLRADELNTMLARTAHDRRRHRRCGTFTDGQRKPGGALSTLHPVEMLSQALSALIERTGVDPAEVQDVLTGCVGQVGEQSSSPGRMAWLAAGLPERVPATTVDRRCGSSQQAMHFAAQGVLAGAYDMVVACGVESMSRVPMGSARLDKDPRGPSVPERYAPGLVPQGISAELYSR